MAPVSASLAEQPGGTSSESRASRSLLRVLGVLLGVLLALLFTEGLLRVAGVLVYATSGRGELASAAPGVRLLCHGDSNVFGIYEPPEESYPGQLEAILDERVDGGPHGVVNLGVPGLGSRQLLSVLEHDMERVDPAAVLVTVGANDAWRWSPDAGASYEEPPFWEELQLAKVVRLYLYRTGRGRIDDELEPHGDLALETPTEEEGETWSIENREGERIRRFVGQTTTDHATDDAYWELLRSDLGRMHDVAGDKLVLVCYGSEGTAYGEANAVFREVAAERSIALVDPTEELEELVRRTSFGEVFWADLHPRGLGYELIARAVFDDLATRGVLDGEPFDDRLDGLRERERVRPPIELSGALGEGDGLVLEISGEAPGRTFAVVLWDVHRGDEPPPERTYFEVVQGDAVYKKSFRDESLRGRFDDDGVGRVTLDPFVAGFATEGEVRGLRMRAGYIVYAGDGHEILSRFSDAVVVELR